MKKKTKTKEQIAKENLELLRQNEKLRADLKTSELYFNVAEVIMVVISKDQHVRAINAKGCDTLGYTKDELVGKNWFDTCIPASIVRDVKKAWDDIMTGRLEFVEYFENSIVTRNGNDRIISWHNSVIYDKNGAIDAILSSGDDITEIRQKEEIISAQTDSIMELSTPILQVWQGIVVAPLIGTIDSMRTQQFMDRLLTSITTTKSPVALIDITGVPTIDTQTAQHVIEAITAASLLGTKVIITGISPTIAQTLVHLGIDLSSVITKSSLSAGLEVAFDLQELSVMKKDTKEGI